MSSMVNRNRQRGFSLAEVMVATAILVVILVGILTLYDRANKVFKSGNEAAEMQQNVRIAYDRMLADIRMAGFDYKRGGPLLPGQTAAPWAPTRTYSAGTLVTPPTPNGHTYRATNAGTSGSAPPGGWPTTTGQTFVETGATPAITWQENGGAVYEQPDEQIEYAGSTALTVRGNFDYSANTPGDTDHGREPALEISSGGSFPMVTTGNDEIVTYALVSDQAPAGTAPNNQSVTMYIDINSGGTPTRTAHPGGNAERQVNITGVDLTNNNPPYTLYRFTFADDGSVQRTPLATNIRSLNFFYYQDPQGTQPLTDAAGNLAPNVAGLGQYDPAVAGSINSPDRLVRKKIHAVRVRLVGMASQPDNNYVDTSTANGQLGSTSTAGVPSFVTDTATVASTSRPMNNYRRVAVDTLVVPRNLGRTGLAQTFLQPPPQPTITQVCFGYCGIATISWNPNTNNPNASYVVMWDRSCGGSFSNAFDAGTSNTFAVDLTEEDLSQPFCFQVRAFNAGGSVFSTNTMSASVQNRTTPNIPTNVTITGSTSPVVPPIAGKIRLTWSAPVTNASGNPSCTSGSPTVNNYLREIKGFRIYRGTNGSDNAPAPMTLVVDENTSGPTAPSSDGYGNYTWDDTNVVCGTTYYYRFQTVEWCAAQDNYNTSGNLSDAMSAYFPINSAQAKDGKSGTSGTPQTPVNFQIAPDAPNTPPLGLTASSCDSLTNFCTVNMGWSRVTQDTGNSPVSIDTYELQRDQYTTNALGAQVPTGVSTTLQKTNALAQPGSQILYTDSTAPYLDTTTGLRYSYKYKVRALQASPPTAPCPASAWSAVADYPPPCTFTGSVIVETGASAGDGLTPATAWVMNVGDTIQVNPPSGTTFVNTTMNVVDPSGTPVFTPPQSTTSSPANFTWANLTPGTPYTVTFTMTNNAVPPCTEQLVRYIQQEPLPACSLTTFATQSSILGPSGITNQLKLDLINGANEALNMTQMYFEFTVPNRRGWNSIQFPSGGTVTGPVQTSPFTATVSPRPAGLTANDVTVPANGTRSLLLNWGAVPGNGPQGTPTASNYTFICITYTRPSITQLTSVISSIAVTAGGSGYTSAPTVTINDPSGSGATATATISGGSVTAITVTAGGQGYVSPTVVISGGGGSGATATATTVQQQVPIKFSCAIKPDAQANNPTSCR